MNAALLTRNLGNGFPGQALVTNPARTALVTS